MVTLASNYFVKNFAKILNENRYVRVSSDFLRTEYQIVEKIRSYNRKAKINCFIPISKTDKDKLKIIKSIKDPESRSKLDEIIALIELKQYFSKQKI